MLVSTLIARRRDHPQAGSMPIRLTWTLTVHGDGLISLQHGRPRAADSDDRRSNRLPTADVIELKRRGHRYIFLVGEVRRADGTTRSSTDWTSGPSRTSACSPVPQPGRHRTRRRSRNVRIVRAAKGLTSCRIATTSAATGSAGHRDGASQVVHKSRGSLRGAELDARRQDADLQRQRQALSVRPRDRRRVSRRSTRASRPATTTITCCRSTARMLGISDPAQDRCRSVDDLRGAARAAGEPKRVTPLSTVLPPRLVDRTGSRCSIRGRRNGEFDIYKTAPAAAAKRFG